METARAAQPTERAGFEVGFITENGVEHQVSLAEAGAVLFELGIPVRRFISRKGHWHLSGLSWSATTGGHASQPFWLRWMNESGQRVAHAPDYFVRRADCSVVVIDCRPVERRKPPDVAKFVATARACAEMSWQYTLIGAADAVATANLRWLGGYRHPRHHVPATAEVLRPATNDPRPPPTRWIRHEARIGSTMSGSPLTAPFPPLRRRVAQTPMWLPR